MTLTIYGIPTCGTCKKALQWLKGQGIAHNFVNFKDHTPNQDEIRDWVETLGAKALRNTSGQSYRALGDKKQEWTEEQWIEAFAQDAMLIKRPLIVKDGKAIIAGFRLSEAELKEKLT